MVDSPPPCPHEAIEAIDLMRLRTPEGVCRLCDQHEHLPRCPGRIIETLRVELRCHVQGEHLSLQADAAAPLIERMARVLSWSGADPQKVRCSFRYVTGDTDDLATSVLVAASVGRVLARGHAQFGRVPTRAERYDGLDVLLVPREDAPAVRLDGNEGGHVWDNPPLAVRDDVRLALAYCELCGARLALAPDGRLLYLATGRGPFQEARDRVVATVPNGAPPEALVPTCRNAALRALGTVKNPRALRPFPRSRVERDDDRLARADFVRAAGDCLCPCGEPYRVHGADPVDEFLTVLCDGTRVKL